MVDDSLQSEEASATPLARLYSRVAALERELQRSRSEAAAEKSERRRLGAALGLFVCAWAAQAKSRRRDDALAKAEARALAREAAAAERIDAATLSAKLDAVLELQRRQLGLGEEEVERIEEGEG